MDRRSNSTQEDIRTISIGRTLDDYNLDPNLPRSIFGHTGLLVSANVEQVVASQISWAEAVASSRANGDYVWNSNSAILRTNWIDIGFVPSDGRPLQASLVAFYSVVSQFPRQAALRHAELQLCSTIADGQLPDLRGPVVARFDKVRQAVLLPDPDEKYFAEGREVMPGSIEWAKISSIVSRIGFSPQKASLYRKLVNNILRPDTSL
jgi:hypothetical protein